MATAGSVAWAFAGPPPDAAAVVPPPCPAVPGPPGAAVPDRRTGAVDVLVPMPLPQPRGPVSVRLCGYRQDGDRQVIERERLLDPTRTAALAGLLNSPPPGTEVASTPNAPVDGCPAGPAPVVLVFRYTEGDPAVVEVVGGPCAIAVTSARLERGRGDVVREVDRLLTDGVRVAR